jgi:hypothetical protein
MIYRTSKALAFAFILLGACQGPQDFENFDEEAFRDDPMGCEGVREAMKEEIFLLTDPLIGLSQRQVDATLGKPDRQELAARSQKYFVYFIEPAPSCESNSEEEPLTMYVRFNSVGQANEISFKNY